MANEIRMTPDQMDERAGQYDEQRDIVDGVITSMSNLLTQLQGEWTGKAAEAYAAKFEELKPGFEKARDLIHDIAQSLRQSAAAIRETDENIAAAYGSTSGS